jgi:hypothetical protein
MRAQLAKFHRKVFGDENQSGAALAGGRAEMRSHAASAHDGARRYNKHRLFLPLQVLGRFAVEAQS